MVTEDRPEGAGTHPIEARAGPRRPRKVPPYLQVLALGIMSAIALGTVAGTALLEHTEIRDQTSREKHELLPTLAHLSSAAEHYHELGLGLVGMATQLPVEERFPVLAAMLPDVNEANEAWRAFEREAAGLPGEASLRRRISSSVRRGSDLAAQAASPSGSSPQVAAELLVTIGTQQQAFAALGRVYRNELADLGAEVAEGTAEETRSLVIGTTVAGVLLLVGTLVTYRSSRTRDREVTRRARHSELETDLHRALEMAHTEDEAYEVIERALRVVALHAPVELLVADSSRAHFRQVVSTDAHGGPGCPVGTPQDCPVVARGRAEVFQSSGDLAACLHLADRPTGACSAVCVPVAIAGKTVGVVHSTGPEGRMPSAERIDELELVARKTGERLGMLRALSRSEQQARTDSLTGLLNRRSLEAQVADLIDEGVPYVVAFGDLDHFKDLNDVHGHDAGDQALRLFARVLRDSVRPADIPARFGGEEFVVVLPECSLRDAYTVLERVRDRLEIAERNGLTPHFTVSFGLAPFQPHVSFGEVLARADTALLAAKAEGRDRVVVSGADGTETEITATVHRLEVSG